MNSKKAKEGYNCHTYPKGEDTKRSKKAVWTAEAVCCSKKIPKNPKKPVWHYFSYEPLDEFKDTNSFKQELEQAFQPEKCTARPRTPDYAQLIECDKKGKLCKKCPNAERCKHKRSFSRVYKIDYSLHIKVCPVCGSNLYPWSNESTDSPAIHDVRLKGYPAVLVFHKDEIRWCPKCKDTIAGVRVPGVQHIKRGTFTLRLIRSLFELSIANVSNKYVAEGYFLTRDSVEKVNKRFRSRSATEFESRLKELFSEKTSKDFYEEEIFLDNRKFIAIFDKKDNVLLTIFSANELANISDFFYGEIENLHQFKSARSLTLATQFFLTKTLFFEKELITSAVQLNYACSLDHEEDIKDGYKKRDSAPEWKQKIEEGVPIAYYINELYYTTADFSRKAFNFQLGEFKQFGELIDEISKISETGESIPSTYRRTLRALKKLKRTIEKTKENLTEWEERFANGVFGREYYCTEDRDNTPYREVCKLIESCSKESEFSLSEQLARLQYYNELSVFPILPSEQEKFPVLDEKGWPSFENTRLGQGIPIECLTHLLNNGLLDKDSLPPACIRQRLGVAKHEYSGNCTIENCPFLT